MLFFRIFQHLLPNAKAWALVPGTYIRSFFEGIASVGPDTKTFVDQVWLDLFPDSTRCLDDWEEQWNLSDSGLSDEARRTRLATTWQSLGGQSPRYIQDVLQGNDFDVYVHEWWVPETSPPIARNPLTVLSGEDPAWVTEAGEALAEAGEPTALAGELVSSPGYVLVNDVSETSTNLLSLAGEAIMEAGESEALAGNFTEFSTSQVEYFPTADELTWPYYVYIGSSVFGAPAQIAASRRQEFEELCLKICPAHLWIGVIVEYT